MEKIEIIEKVNQVLIEKFELKKSLLYPEAHFNNDLKLDSLDAVDMVVCFEDELQIKVSGDSFSQVQTLGDIYQLVYETVNGQEKH